MKRSEVAINVQSIAYIEQMYAEAQRNPAKASAEWKNYFAATNGSANGSPKLQPSFKPRSVFNPMPDWSTRLPEPSFEVVPESVSDRLYRLVQNHRLYGHLIAA